MPDPTPRFGLDDYDPGEDPPWDHSDTVQLLDELAVERDTAANRPASGEYDDELFLATDQFTLYQWDADAGDWSAVAGLGTSGSPLPFYASTLNGADVENAAAGTVPTAQGDGSLSMAEAGDASIYDTGDTVVLDRTYYAPVSITGTSTSWFEPPEGSETYANRAITDYRHFDYSGLTNYRIQFGVYRFARENGSGNVEVAVGSHGNAPGDNTTPVDSGSIIQTQGEEWRPTTTFSINLSSYGKWTPAVILQANNGGEYGLDGFASFTLLADVA